MIQTNNGRYHYDLNNIYSLNKVIYFDKNNNTILLYLKKIAFKQLYVSVAQISNIIIDSTGVTDYESVTVNGQVSKINLTKEQVAVLGTVSVTLND